MSHTLGHYWVFFFFFFLVKLEKLIWHFVSVYFCVVFCFFLRERDHPWIALVYFAAIMINYSSRLLNVKDELTQKTLQKMHPTSQNYLFYMLHGLIIVIQVGNRLALCFTCSAKLLRHQIACNICRLNVMLSVSDNQAGMPQVYSVFKSSNHQMYYTAFVHTETVILKSSKNNTCSSLIYNLLLLQS